jgi:hypothetical protein
VAEFCLEFLISRKTSHKWLRRYQHEGPAGLRGQIEGQALWACCPKGWSTQLKRSGGDRCAGPDSSGRRDQPPLARVPFACSTCDCRSGDVT